MDFAGEHLLPGKLGHFFILLSFVSSLVATVAYFLSVQQKRRQLPGSDGGAGWKKLGRIFFLLEIISVIAVFGILFYIIRNHLFEYKYAWQHSSRSLEPKYLLSCFWEGQEGSFLLWSFWHCILGGVVILKEKEWEAPVMTVVSAMQLLLATMIIGIDIFGFRIGSNPFVLLRNTMDAPLFSNSDYLSQITDGNDLNPLLQNYWMVIHPPVLFLGFASTLIPFAFVVGGLWTREFNSWTKRVLPWALFSAGTLGLGIMMGAAWAYESLNFGGYWAWDPVENASLVPWLVLVAGIHTLLVYRHTGNALRTTALFLIGSQLLVLYSTYLTRSGVLQETSVHAFTGEGITATQLKIFLAALALPSLFVYFRHYKSIPHIVKEEETSSREFWMFVGSLVLFLSAASIIIMTSIPVFNKIVALFTGKESTFKPLAMGEDSAMAYNRIQLFVAVVIGLLSGFGMYLKYKSTGKPFLRKLLLPTAIGAVAAALILIFGDVNFREEGVLYLGAIWLAIVAAVYSVIANGAYLVTGLKGNLRRAGGAIGHVGFGLMLLGILLSSSKKEVLSFNTSGIFVNFGEGSKERPGENLTLIKGVRTDMGKYWVTYVKDSTHPKKSLWYYHLLFERKDGKEQFTLTPNAFVNYKGNEGLMANPDSKHYAGHDIFTYITSLPDPAKNRDTANFRTQSVEVGDTIYYSSGYAILEDLTSRGNIPQAGFAPTDSATLATVKVYGKTGSTYSLESLLVMKNGLPMTSPDTALAESLIVRLDRVNGRQVELAVKESNSVMQYVTLKAYKFPAINVLWIGTILMVIGFFVAAAWRIRSNRQKR